MLHFKVSLKPAQHRCVLEGLIINLSAEDCALDAFGSGISACTQTLACMQALTNTHMHTHRHTCMHAHTHTHTHRCTHTHSLTDTHTHTHTFHAIAIHMILIHSYMVFSPLFSLLCAFQTLAHNRGGRQQVDGLSPESEHPQSHYTHRSSEQVNVLGGREERGGVGA